MTYQEVLKDWNDIKYYFGKVFNREHEIMTHEAFMILESSIFNLNKEIKQLKGWDRAKGEIIKYKAQSLYLKAERAGKW